MGSCPCKGFGGQIARFRPNPQGKCLFGRSAALQSLAGHQPDCVLRLAAYPEKTLAWPRIDREQALNHCVVTSGADLKILVIDDHALVREGLRQVLKGLDENVDVLQAGTCEQAFALAQSHHDLDLALLDYHLPDMTGLQLAKAIRRVRENIPIVLCTGNAQVIARGRVEEEKIQALLVKPVETARLTELIERLLPAGGA